MRTPSTYHPGALTTAYSPSKAAWPLASWVLTLLVVQQAHSQPVTGRASYPKATYRPQTALPAAAPAAAEFPFEETELAAMPVRSYRVNATIREAKKGQLLF